MSSPTKRRRISESQSPNECEISNNDLWKWTLTKEAISSCSVGDVLEMRESTSAKDVDYFWLGRVPCRTVVLVGLVVGLTPYEKRTVYTLDDGTGVVDCSYRLTPPSPAEPLKSRKASSSSSKSVSVSPSKNSQKVPKQAPVPDPPYSLFGLRPTAADQKVPSSSKRVYVGSFIRVEGRVSKLHDGRQIIVQDIEVVTASHELKHRQNVRDLHRSYYHDHTLGTFLPPKLDKSTASQLPKTPTKSKPPTILRPATPTAPHTPPKPTHDGDHLPSSTLHTPCSQAPNTDCSESECSEWSPRKTRIPSIKLRHPTRLHSRDLTANTFKIYLKYFMDNATPAPVPGTFMNWDVSTPRKIRSRPMPNWGDETPKPSKALPTSTTIGSSSEATADSLVLDAPPTRKGFTLSFLRRIPELSQLAKRIIEVEAKRRAKEEREKSRLAAKTGKASNPTRSDGRRGVGEAPTNSSTLPTSLGKSTRLKRHGSTDKENDQGKGAMADALPTSRKDKEMMGPRIKRLFTFAIRRLYDEGSIVLWEGPIHPCDGDSLGVASDGISSIMSQSLWKTSSSRHVSQASTIEFSTSSVSSMSVVDPSFSCEDEAPLSDPQEGEEAYVSVTPAFLAPFVEAAVEELTRRGIKSQRVSSASASRSLSSKQPTLSQAGPTQSQITTYLQRVDSRWARIGDWSISEALDELQELGRVWVVSGQGKEARWEKCL